MSADLTCKRCNGGRKVYAADEGEWTDQRCPDCDGSGRRRPYLAEWDALKVDRDWLDVLLRRGLRAWRKCRKERDRYREALVTIAGLRQEADEWEHPDFDWRMLAHKQERIARAALEEKR